jgi:iron complex transport system substrate-binding protein
MSRRSWVAHTLSARVAFALSGCASHPPVSSQRGRNCVTDFRQGVDYFPGKSTIVDASNFTLSYHGSYQVLTVNQPYPQGRPEFCVLVRRGTPAPTTDGLAGARRITTNAVTTLVGAPIVVVVLLRSRHGIGMQR